MVELQVAGMSCAHCVRAVTEAIRARDPGASVAIDLPTGAVRAATTLAADQVAAAVVAAGYTVQR